MDYYGMDGKQIPRDEAMALFESNTARQVARDERDGVTVSTVLLVINHNWDNGPPLIFETMIFGRNENDEYQERYATREEAEAGHRIACEIAFGVPA